jgi:transposase
MKTRPAYPTDLSDRQWARLEPLLPKPPGGGRPIKVPRRELVNAMLSVLRNGISWRAMPHDFPPWRTVSHDFRAWERDGTWERIHETVRDQVRVAAGRQVSPSAAIIDSQSVKTTEKGGLGAMMRARRCWDASAT